MIRKFFDMLYGLHYTPVATFSQITRWTVEGTRTGEITTHTFMLHEATGKFTGDVYRKYTMDEMGPKSYGEMAPNADRLRLAVKMWAGGFIDIATIENDPELYCHFNPSDNYTDDPPTPQPVADGNVITVDFKK